MQALKDIPAVNAEIDGTDIVYKNYYHIGVAVGTERGSVVPVLRDADRMSLAEIEAAIADFGTRAREGRLGLEEMIGISAFAGGGPTTPLIDAGRCSRHIRYWAAYPSRLRVSFRRVTASWVTAGVRCRLSLAETRQIGVSFKQSRLTAASFPARQWPRSAVGLRSLPAIRNRQIQTAMLFGPGSRRRTEVTRQSQIQTSTTIWRLAIHRPILTLRFSRMCTITKTRMSSRT